VTKTEEKARSQLKSRRAERTLIKIIAKERARGTMSPKEVKGDSRRSLRAAIAKRSPDQSGSSLAEISRHVGVITSKITRAAARTEETERALG